jgi:hypothetical protein
MTTLMTQHFRHKMLFMTNFVLNMTLYFCHTKPFFCSAWFLNKAINLKSGSEFTGGGRQCWGLVLKCYELRTRQHKNVKYKCPSSAEALSPQGFNELRTKVMSKISRRFHLRDHTCKTTNNEK